MRYPITGGLKIGNATSHISSLFFKVYQCLFLARICVGEKNVCSLIIAKLPGRGRDAWPVLLSFSVDCTFTSLRTICRNLRQRPCVVHLLGGCNKFARFLEVVRNDMAMQCKCFLVMISGYFDALEAT